MILSYINSVLIIIILIVIIVDSIYLYYTRKDVRTLAYRVAEKKTLVDLAEFEHLDDKIKTDYKNYVVNGIMPIVNSAVNQIAVETKGDLSQLVGLVPI